MSKKSSQRIRKASGKINSKSLLVAFLYTLIRDDVPPGRIEDIMQNITADILNSKRHEFSYSNGWLASYCKDIAKRLTD